MCVLYWISSLFGLGCVTFDLFVFMLLFVWFYFDCWFLVVVVLFFCLCCLWVLCYFWVQVCFCFAVCFTGFVCCELFSLVGILLARYLVFIALRWLFLLFSMLLVWVLIDSVVVCDIVYTICFEYFGFMELLILGLIVYRCWCCCVFI